MKDIFNIELTMNAISEHVHVLCCSTYFRFHYIFWGYPAIMVSWEISVLFLNLVMLLSIRFSYNCRNEYIDCTFKLRMYQLCELIEEMGYKFIASWFYG
jgi:hypothetical protein